MVYTTANPSMLGEGVEGAVGVLPKPYAPDAMEAVVEYALKLRQGDCPTPPRRLLVFSATERRAYA